MNQEGSTARTESHASDRIAHRRHTATPQTINGVEMSVCSVCGKVREAFQTRGGNQREWRIPAENLNG